MTNTNNLPNPNCGTRRSRRNSPSIHEKHIAFTRATLNSNWLSGLPLTTKCRKDSTVSLQQLFGKNRREASLMLHFCIIENAIIS